MRNTKKEGKVLEQQKQSFEEQQENRKMALDKQMFERDKNQRMMQLLLETASALGQIQVDKSAYISGTYKKKCFNGYSWSCFSTSIRQRYLFTFNAYNN